MLKFWTKEHTEESNSYRKNQHFFKKCCVLKKNNYKFELSKWKTL